MIHYLARRGSNYYGDYHWQEVAVDESLLQPIENEPLIFLYNGEYVHKCDPDNEKYFYYRFTGQIFWI